MNDLPKLTPRLMCAAELIRQGTVVADIGTDHAYLPIYLCLEGRAQIAVVSDINAGPVARAKENINRYGLCERITVIKTDGLNGIQEYKPDDIMILGMGGELISRIIADAEWTKSSDIQLCLQPMTHAEILRDFLTQNGYTIIDERLVKEEKIYQIILARYTGDIQKLTDVELLFGKINTECKTDIFSELAERQIQILTRRAEGKESAGESAEYERTLISEIKQVTGENI